ncbi:hypothetical protein Z043_105610 [Scleropages formosus]|uniref:SOCS box domain-containing protein n=1 Tax=Scleropages formosus TaxID=113540 RepID=A0A0P7Z3K5_SCLFO|nr:hypothetical protein Z043_105610 [Scleropages formosus]
MSIKFFKISTWAQIVTSPHEQCFSSDKEEIDKKDYYGKTPLYWAAYKDQKASMQLLLNMHGAGVDLPDSWGVTPMYLAACSGQVECIQLLVQAEAKIFYKKKKTGEAPKQLSFRPTLLTWLENLVRQPHSLKHQCRQAVRRALGPARIQTLGSFALPLTLREYLMFQDLQIPNIVGQALGIQGCDASRHPIAGHFAVPKVSLTACQICGPNRKHIYSQQVVQLLDEFRVVGENGIRIL